MALGQVRIRPAAMDDAEALHRACFPQEDPTFVREYLAFCLSHAGITRLVAEVSGQVVGNAELVCRGEYGEIGGLSVAPAFRRQGVARALLGALLGQARELGLRELEMYAVEGEDWLVGFYYRAGFLPAGKKRLPLANDGVEVLCLRMML